MIIEVVLRVDVDDEFTLSEVAEVVDDSMYPLPCRVVSLTQKGDVNNIRGRPAVQRGAAAIWLRLRLARGPTSAQDVFNDGRMMGHSMKTLRRAADDIGVVKTPRGGGRNCKWSLPVEKAA